MYMPISINRLLMLITRSTAVFGIIVSVAASSTAAADPRHLSSGTSSYASTQNEYREEDRIKDAKAVIALIDDPEFFNYIKTLLIDMAKELLKNDEAIAQIAAQHGISPEDVRTIIGSIFDPNFGGDYSPFCDVVEIVKAFFGVNFSVPGCYTRPDGRAEP